MRSRSQNSVQLVESDVQSILLRFGIHISAVQASKVLRYLRILLSWNQSINLTSIHDSEEIIARHFGESMFACFAVPVEKGRLADVGTGAGFPGLALKIINPDLLVTLIEPSKKKCAFLWEIIRALDFENVTVVPKGFENTEFPAHSFDYITTRALGGSSRILRWSKIVLSPKGTLILWLGGTDCANLARKCQWAWETPIKIPDSQRRYLLVGRQTSTI